MGYDEYQKKCVAPEDAQCQKIHTGAWGCVFPSAGCTSTPAPTSESTETPISTDVSTTSTEMPTSTANGSATTPVPTVSHDTKSDDSSGAAHTMVSLAAVIGIV